MMLRCSAGIYTGGAPCTCTVHSPPSTITPKQPPKARSPCRLQREIPGKRRGVRAKLEKPNVSLPGGRLNRFSLSVCGAQSIQTMEGINFDLLLLGVTSYSPETGFTCGVEDEARLKQTVLRRCDCEQKAVLLDSSKIGLKSTFHICELSDIDIVISDGKLPVEFLQACRNAGVTVL